MNLKKEITLTVEDIMNIVTHDAVDIGKDLNDPAIALLIVQLGARIARKMEDLFDERNNPTKSEKVDISVGAMRELGKRYCANKGVCEDCPLLELEDEGCFVEASDEEVIKHFTMLKEEGLV